MKVLIILAVVAFGGIFTNNDMASVSSLRPSTELTNEPKALAKVKIVFGRKSRNCTKFGVCTFDADAGPIEIDLSAVSPGTAMATAGKADGKLVVNFVKSSIAPIDLSTRFANNQFVVEENYTVTLENAMVSSYVIKSGTYDVTPNGKYLTVEF
ncbi:hypothetical protein [Spirosoma aerolatum]|uniref:hypothetical protein n=1 Tax=Spirosoma aerolatum TaxID=1211326 RepID=UPI0009AEE0D1|nr:hypothetical protein [Spirosoma aerolatum]